jgi:hypothetical protein
MCCHVVRSLHRLDGARIAASPNGRLAGFNARFVDISPAEKEELVARAEAD